MAISPTSYATVAEYKALVDKDGVGDDAVIERQLEAVSRYADYKGGQWFGLADDPFDRLIEGNGKTTLRIDGGIDRAPGIANTTGLVIKVDTSGDEDWDNVDALTTAQYRLLPLNADKGPELLPWTKLEIKSGAPVGAFPDGNFVQITGNWGWPSVPKVVVELTIQLTAIWRLENPRATGSVNELDEMVAASPMAQGLVNRLQRMHAPGMVFA